MNNKNKECRLRHSLFLLFHFDILSHISLESAPPTNPNMTNKTYIGKQIIYLITTNVFLRISLSSYFIVSVFYAFAFSSL